MAKPRIDKEKEPAKDKAVQTNGAEPPQRLCSEIQLFDLCDKADCVFRKGRFCTDPTVLARFEAISDDEDENSTEQYLSDEMDEMDEDGLEYDEGIGLGEYDEDEAEDDD
jgi:hypothetical protein